MNIDKEFPSVGYLEKAALKRLPRFVKEYLMGGIGPGVGVQKNRDEMNAVELMPRYMAEADQPDLSCHLLGRDYDAPFGVAPIGLAGLIWPKAEMHLATAAKAHNIPYTLSTVATASLEDIREVSGENTWFQLYTPREKNIRKDLMGRCEQVGYDTLVVTVDVPYQTRREHDIKNGLSVPPRFNLSTLGQMMAHPPWALRMLFSGVPQFANLERYYDQGLPRTRSKNIKESVKFIKERLGLHISRSVFGEIRADWPGTLLVKGVLDPEEARTYLELGADGIVVSNHGGRQLDAAPSSVSVLPLIREAVGPDATLIADSGVRSGLDIARMLALGADFVMMGRPFMFGVAALDHQGGGHVMHLLKSELQSIMGQVGCATVGELPSALVSRNLEKGTPWPTS